MINKLQNEININKMKKVIINLILVFSLVYNLKSQPSQIIIAPNGYTSGNSNMNISDMGSDGTLDFSSYIHSQTVVNSNPITFRLSNSTNGRFEAMRISSEGYIGIGTTAPNYPLAVRQDNGITNAIHGLASFSRFESGIDNAGLNVSYEANGSNVSRTLLYFPGGTGATFQVYNQGTLDVLHLTSNGSVGIGTTNPDPNFKLSVNGSIRSKEVKVEANWPDFVFYENYELLTLEEVEKHIQEKGHLPEIPSESEVTEKGINLGEMDAKLLQKIEELTLYLIEQNKEIKELKEKVLSLEKE